ncbi:hypothetical protein F511_34214 [Dorcoceras hygrometricum]|uniref:Uncharacterized protein n=1 Tax=Dorcoceras hygrometricum TaxID=472368 RepID=A0A2Z7AFC2_9LAMI|nr:hypothetical protein F511_34214 [Dorcoceras hygrometricum]
MNILLTAITFDVKVNWGSLLFGVLKEMVTPDSRQDKGFAIQICVLLKNIPGLELGDSKAFPAPRILNEKTVHRIVSVNENVGVEEVGDAPRAKTTPVKRTVSKKRPASVDADVAPVIKKKRTTKSKPVATKKLVLEEPIAVVPSTEEQIPVAGVATEEHIPVKEIATEDADATIRQVLTQLDLIFEKQDDVQCGRVETWFDRAFDEAFVAGDQEDQASEDLDQIFLELDTAGPTAGTMEVGESSKQTVASKRSFEELMSVDDLLVQICDDMMLPSITDAEISKIRIGESSVMHDKGKGLLVEDEPVQSNPAQEMVELICGDVEFLVDLRDQVMADVVDFFHSFSLNKLTDLDALLALKAKEKLMLDWAETDSLETAVKRRLYILVRYREMLLRKLLDSHRQYLVSGQPWTATASQIFDLLSDVNSKSLEALRILQQEHGIIFEQPCSSTAFDYAVDCGAVFAQFFSVAKSTCWVRPMIFVDGIWTPLQGPDFWRSGCSVFDNQSQDYIESRRKIPTGSMCKRQRFIYVKATPFCNQTQATVELYPDESYSVLFNQSLDLMLNQALENHTWKPVDANKHSPVATFETTLKEIGSGCQSYFRRKFKLIWSRIEGALLSEIQKGFVALFGFIDRWMKDINSRRFELKKITLAIAITELLPNSILSYTLLKASKNLKDSKNSSFDLH